MQSSKTKKYQVPVNTYVKIGLSHVSKQWWWAYLVPVGLVIIGALAGKGWLIGLSITAVVLTILYIVFWSAQFYGLSQMPQGKMLFERLSYEFDHKQIRIMKTQKEGMAMQWENIKNVTRTKTAFILKLSPVQFIHLPFDIFQTEYDLKFTEKLFERKGLIKAS